MSRKRENPSFSRHDFKRRRPLPPPPEEDKPTKRPTPPSAVIIMGLPLDCSVLDLKSRFEIYGSISRIRIDRDAVGYITYRTKESADAAIAAGHDPSFGVTVNSKKICRSMLLTRYAVSQTSTTEANIESKEHERLREVQLLWATDPLAMWREGVGKNKDNVSMSKLVRAEVPLRRHGRGNRLASAIGKTKSSEDGSSSSVLEVPFKGREIVAYDDIL